jgi:predicted nucleic acid-binding protein
MTNRYLLDTNIIIYSINGGLELPEASYYMSHISYNEIFSNPKMSENEKESIESILKKIDILETNDIIKHNTSQIQEKYKLSKADSTLCATAHTYNLTLITNDNALHEVKEIKTELFYFS